MGQYRKVVNLTKKEWLNPHRFGDGMKLLEFGASDYGTMLALAVLLSDSPNAGGSGDLRSDDREWYGRWAGDNIIVTGDYAETGPACEPGKPCLYDRCDDELTDISAHIWKVIRDAGEPIRGGGTR